VNDLSLNVFSSAVTTPYSRPSFEAYLVMLNMLNSSEQFCIFRSLTLVIDAYSACACTTYAV